MARGKSTMKETEQQDQFDQTERVNSDDENYQEQFSDDDYTEDICSDDLVYPGLIMNDTYIILKKIGYGKNAHVWMVYAYKIDKYVAMKIQDHEVYHDGCREVNIHKAIYNATLNSKEDIHVARMLDFFIYQSDETKFVCSIYDLYAHGLHILLQSGKLKYGLQINIVKNICTQILLGLKFLHETVNVIHCDLKPANILFKGHMNSNIKAINSFEESGFREKYIDLSSKYKNDYKILEQELEELARESVKEIDQNDIEKDEHKENIKDEIEEEEYLSDTNDDDDEIEIMYDESDLHNKRTQSVPDLTQYLNDMEIHNLDEFYEFEEVLNRRALGISTDNESIIDDKYIEDCKIAITDFGNSYFAEKRSSTMEVQDRFYRAPEVILNFQYSYECDIWSLGCIVYELLTGFILFEPEIQPATKDIHHLFLMEKLLGPMPVNFKKQSKRRDFLFDSKRNYHIKNTKEFQQYPLKDRLIKQFMFNENDAEACSEFILACLVYNPKKRPSAAQLLDHPWLK